MKKSVYSVVLSDDVVSMVDRIAYKNNTNRSNMINQILAEYVSMTTPEKKISDIFDELSQLLYSGENFREFAKPTPSVMYLRSALAYKYNPTVKYTVELFRDYTDSCQGEIRVSARTTNSELIYKMLEFYKLFTDIEVYYGFEGRNTFENGVFKRPIMIKKCPYCSDIYEETVGNVIAKYISMFDSAMKLYFSTNDEVKPKIKEMYRQYLLTNSRIV